MIIYTRSLDQIIFNPVDDPRHVVNATVLLTKHNFPLQTKCGEKLFVLIFLSLYIHEIERMQQLEFYNDKDLGKSTPTKIGPLKR